MSSRPIAIYLDTSDYSRFADLGRRDDPDAAQTLELLRDSTSRGLIEVRFSAIHLFEFLKDPSQRDLALRKVRIVEELCGDRTFRFFGNVFEIERKNRDARVTLRDLVTSDNGEWFPATPEVTLERDVVVDRVLESFPSLGRKQLEAMLPQAAAYLKQEMARQMPLSGTYESDLIERFLEGRTTGEEMGKRLTGGFAKPSVLIAHYLKGNPKAEALFGMLAEREKSLHEQLVEGRDRVKAISQLHLSLGGDINEPRSWVTHSRPTLDRARAELATLPPHDQQAILRGEYSANFPATSVYFNVVNAYIRDIIYPSKVMPEIKESDAADILHALYLPFVDLYRTDGRFAALLGRVPLPAGTTVVPKLRGLRQEVLSRIAENECS